jgi:hypothetical protein
MTYSEQDDTKLMKQTITIEVFDLDMIGLKLKEDDRLLLEECSNSDKISDKLLALELIARKIELYYGSNSQ